MKKKIKALLKNQKGFTLVELLAVIVILGIIGAIAVPSIAGIIDNSKKDAHVANAQQMVSAARLAVAANDVTFAADGTATLTLEKLTSLGYLESGLKDPDGGVAYPAGTEAAPKSFVKITKTTGTASTTTGVTTTTAGTVTYGVTVIGSERSIGSATVPIAASDLKRDKVVKNS